MIWLVVYQTLAFDAIPFLFTKNLSFTVWLFLLLYLLVYWIPFLGDYFPCFVIPFLQDVGMLRYSPECKSLTFWNITTIFALLDVHRHGLHELGCCLIAS